MDEQQISGAATPQDGADWRIITLPPALDALGLVLSLLSKHPPFSSLDLKTAHDAVRYQLRYALNVAAITPSGKILGYVGWVRTLEARADLWLAGKANLRVMTDGHDAIACTLVVSTNPVVTRALIRQARRLNQGLRVFFKRSYTDEAVLERKNSVRV